MRDTASTAAGRAAKLVPLAINCPVRFRKVVTTDTNGVIRLSERFAQSQQQMYSELMSDKGQNWSDTP